MGLYPNNSSYEIRQSLKHDYNECRVTQESIVAVLHELGLSYTHRNEVKR